LAARRKTAALALFAITKAQTHLTVGVKRRVSVGFLSATGRFCAAHQAGFIGLVGG